MKNAMQLKAIIKNLAKEKHISAQLVMQNFMLGRLLERIFNWMPLRDYVSVVERQFTMLRSVLGYPHCMRTGKSKSNLPNLLSMSKSRMIKLLPQ